MVGANPSSSARRSHMVMRALPVASLPSSGRVGMGFFEKAPDRRDFSDRRAVVEDKDRHLLARIDRFEPVGELFLFAQIHRLERDR